MSTKTHFSEKVFDLDSISEKVNNWKGKNHIVFTNGCFDILHLGHIDYLFRASKLASLTDLDKPISSACIINNLSLSE